MKILQIKKHGSYEICVSDNGMNVVKDSLACVVPLNFDYYGVRDGFPDSRLDHELEIGECALDFYYHVDFSKRDDAIDDLKKRFVSDFESLEKVCENMGFKLECTRLKNIYNIKVLTMVVPFRFRIRGI
ncbi:MAG TPA: hypothetical protein VJJ23_03310 [Candidatus Nanoarchaeia archaeon]|nr:hypothetical protein [Candidatus Nanoarchaeia archaeon]